MFFTPNGLEQSTRSSVAEHRAARLVAAGVSRVVDLCCGVGGDALALARAGVGVHAIDLDPLTCEVARANAAALGVADLMSVECADATEADLAGYDAALIDPARRTARGRTFDPESYMPPFSFLPVLASRVPAGAAKVAPGIPHDIVPPGMEAEWVSDRGDVKEAVLWWGDLAAADVRATLLPSGAALTRTAGPERRAGVGPVRRWLYEPDGAVIRAHLVAEVGDLVAGTLIDDTIAYLTSDRLVPTPYASAYEVTDVLPFNLKRPQGAPARARRRQPHRQEARLRGGARGGPPPGQALGADSATVLLTRVAGAPSMLIARPAAEADQAM